MIARIAAAVASLALTATAIAVWPHLPDGTPPPVRPMLIATAWVGFAFGAWLVMRLPVRQAVALALAGVIVLQIAASFGPPRSSDDLYRYIWDGRVQAAGIDPYRYPPAAAELVHLRDDFLWPARATWCVSTGAVDEATGTPLAPGCTLINRPTVPTIYPPAAEWLFGAVHAVSPPGSTYRPMQAAASLFALATATLLIVGLRRRGDDPRRAVLWAWCPVVAIEAGSNAHVDVVAAGLTAAALLVVASGPAARSNRVAGVGGALLGLAIATKLTPLLVVPAVLRRRPLAVVGAAASTVVLAYLAHVVSVGASVVGYLPGYLREEGYGSGTRFALLTWLSPDSWALPLAALILAIVAVVAARTASPESPWHSAALVVGAGILLTSPAYTWYSLLLVVLVALGARQVWLAVAAAGYVAQYATELSLSSGAARQVGYGVAALCLATSWLMHARGRGALQQSLRRYRMTV